MQTYVNMNSAASILCSHLVNIDFYPLLNREVVLHQAFSKNGPKVSAGGFRVTKKQFLKYFYNSFLQNKIILNLEIMQKDDSVLMPLL